jgi:hypothetical protein
MTEDSVLLADMWQRLSVLVGTEALRQALH